MSHDYTNDRLTPEQIIDEIEKACLSCAGWKVAYPGVGLRDIRPKVLEYLEKAKPWGVEVTRPKFPRNADKPFEVTWHHSKFGWPTGHGASRLEDDAFNLLCRLERVSRGMVPSNGNMAIDDDLRENRPLDKTKEVGALPAVCPSLPTAPPEKNPRKVFEEWQKELAEKPPTVIEDLSWR